MNVMVKHALQDKKVLAGIGVIVFLGIAALGWLLYGSFRSRINEQAQFAFSLQLENFEKLRRDTAADKQAWEGMEQELARAYQEHGSSDLAPFYLALQADAALHAQKSHEAIVLFEKAVHAMGSSNPLYYLYKTKLQIARLASDDAPIREEGNRELRALAQDIHNPQRGYAWYQIWHQAWVHGDDAVAEEALAKLASTQGQGSQWGQLAQAKMEFLA